MNENDSPQPFDRFRVTVMVPVKDRPRRRDLVNDRLRELSSHMIECGLGSMLAMWLAHRASALFLYARSALARVVRPDGPPTDPTLREIFALWLSVNVLRAYVWLDNVVVTWAVHMEDRTVSRRKRKLRRR